MNSATPVEDMTTAETRKTWTTALVRGQDLKTGDVMLHENVWHWVADVFEDGSQAVDQYGETFGAQYVKLLENAAEGVQAARLIDDRASTCNEYVDRVVIVAPLDLITIQQEVS